MGNENCHVCSDPCAHNCNNCKRSVCADCSSYERRDGYGTRYNFTCKHHKPNWSTWIYVYLCQGLGCDQPILESLYPTLRDISTTHLFRHETFDLLRFVALAQQEKQKQAEKKKAKEEKRDLSPLRGSESEQEIITAEDEIVHPIRSLYFPADPSQGREQKIRAVFEFRENQKWLSLDWRPWGGENQVGVIRCTPDTPNEILIFSYLLTREVIHGLTIGKWRHDDQRKRYKKFKHYNTKLLKKGHEEGKIQQMNYRYLAIGSGVYYDNVD
jgi:hypothetical protein